MLGGRKVRSNKGKKRGSYKMKNIIPLRLKP